MSYIQDRVTQHSYVAPTLTVFGSMVELTAAGNSGSCEAAGTGSSCATAGTDMTKKK